MGRVRHLKLTELEAGLDEIRQSPDDRGVLELIVRRPATNLREVLTQDIATWQKVVKAANIKLGG